MLQRIGGATLEEIMKTTCWQKHTGRGFISILGSKDGIKIASRRRERDGGRVYEALQDRTELEPPSHKPGRLFSSQPVQVKQAQCFEQ